MTTAVAPQICCDGCGDGAPEDVGIKRFILAGVATLQDGSKMYVAYCIDCRLIIRAGESDVRHFEPNR